MSSDRRFYVLGEIGINHSRGLFGEQRDALRDCTALRPGSIHYRNRLVVTLDDDFRPGARTKAKSLVASASGM